MGKPLKTAISVGVIATAIAAATALLTGGEPGIVPTGLNTGSASPVAGQVVYTARTANDAAITLPDVVQAWLRQAGLAHQSIELTRVGYTGTVSTSDVDLTPRTGNSPQDPVLKVAGRALPAIDAKISSIQTAINSAADTTGGRALYTGLTRTDFTGAPVIIISSGLDLAGPDNFRFLNWKVPPTEVVADVKRTGDQPALHSPVTFVLVPTAGPQTQLGQAQKNYLKAVWTALLKASGATSVTFINADSTTTGSNGPAAATVPRPVDPKLEKRASRLTG